MSSRTLSSFLFIAYCTIYVSAASGSASSPFARRDVTCPAGQYASTVGGVTSCYNCLAGSYSAHSGATSCTPASPGSYVPNAGASSQTPCPAGTYSSASNTIQCLSCPPGKFCPTTGVIVPTLCARGSFSPGGTVSVCTKCPAGTFTGLAGASSCCPCCANFYATGSGNSGCNNCPDNKPYSNPGSQNPGACVSSPQLYTKQDNCEQSSLDTCPPSAPVSSPVVRRSTVYKRKCMPWQKACPIYGSNSQGSTKVIAGYECINVLSDLESCGGCVFQSLDGRRGKDGGRDCSAIPHVDSVRCRDGVCVISACRRGFVKSADGEHCISTHDRLLHQVPQFQL
ncbi:hypothetical protein L208DRAFT_1244744 [Tricholoma matsutake]|nr:hypothetical protein L208DRAFT_1244744 [Tricholoma matsutake 945]